MSDIEFELMAVPDDIVDIEYPCEICGKESGPYSGRGRKPKRCAEHKAKQSTPRKAGKLPAKVEANAAMAAEILAQYNGLAGLGLRLVTYHDTADAIVGANPVFKELAYNALISDPALAESIIRTGGMPGKVALIVAYATFGAAVAPVAMLELRSKRADKRARIDAEYADDTRT